MDVHLPLPLTLSNVKGSSGEMILDIEDVEDPYQAIRSFPEVFNICEIRCGGLGTLLTKPLLAHGVWRKRSDITWINQRNRRRA